MPAERTASLVLKDTGRSRSDHIVSEVPRLLAAAGDPAAADELLDLICADLRTLAVARLAAETPARLCNRAPLMHDEYLRLVGDGPDRPWNGGRFFVAATEAIGHILVE